MARFSKQERVKLIIGVGCIGLIFLIVLGGVVRSCIDPGASSWVPSINIGPIHLGGTGTWQTIQTKAFDADDIADVSALDVDWSTGELVIKRGNDSQLRITEDVRQDAGSRTGEAPDPSSVAVQDGVVTIREADTPDGRDAPWDGANRRITVEVPASLAEGALRELSIDGGAGTYELYDLACETLTAKITAGSLEADGIDAQTLDASFSAGSVEVSGAIHDALTLSGEAGAAEVRCAGTMPARIDLSFSAGSIELTLPSDAGFTAQVDAALGSLESDFDLVRTDGAGDSGDPSGTYRVGNGDAAITADYSTGSLSIMRA